MNNVSVRAVFDRKNKATKNHQGLVQLEVMYQRKRKYLGTGIKLYSDQWGKDSNVKNHPQSSVLNRKLDCMISSIHDFVYQLDCKGELFSFEKFDQRFCQDTLGDPTSFIQFALKRLSIRKIAESTKTKHIGVINALEEFGLIKKFEDITLKNIKLFDDYVRKRCNKQSSVYNYHKTIKMFVREAIALQLLDLDPYLTFKTERGKNESIRYLTAEELKSIEETEIVDGCLSRVRDMFVFCCYTGMAYVDLCNFDFNKDATLVDGMYRVISYRQKTGTEYNISLLDKPMNILKKYGFKLPVISNQKYNMYLKAVGAICGIKKRITTHVARHTFATTVTLANGVRVETVSKMLGHTNIKTTQVYAKICQKEVDGEFNRLNDIL